MSDKIDFFIAGAAKSGTTSLLRYLAGYDEVMTHQQPEMTFFSSDFEYSKGFNYALGRYFPERETCATQKLIAKDATAFYEQEFASRILKHNDNVKLVLVLRNPIDRAYSSYWYSRRRGWENKANFEEALAAESERNTKKDVYWGKTAYLFRGVYYPHVKNILELTGDDGLRVVLQEDLKNDPEEVCRSLMEWFGLDLEESLGGATSKKLNIAGAPRSVLVARGIAWFFSANNPVKRTLRRIIPLKWSDNVKRNLLAMNDKPFTPPPMSEEVRERLRAYFREHNQKLSELIKRDLSHWK